MVPYLSRIEGPPPKRNVARSNRAGIAILPTRFDRFALKKATVKLVGFFFFGTLRNAKNLLIEDDTC